MAARAPWLMLAVFLGQAGVLSLLRSGTSYDGAEQLIYTQVFDFGYGRSQPPLFTWMLLGMQQVFGVSQIAENLLKFALLGAGFAAIWRIAVALGSDRVVAAAAMVSLFLTVEIGFEAQRNYTHSVLLFALTGWIAVIYLGLLERRSVGQYLLMGALMGAVMLSKYNAALMIFALVVADLSLREAGVFRAKASGLVWLVAAVVGLPHAIWAVANPDEVFALSAGFVGGQAPSLAATAVRGVGAYLEAALGLLGPLALVAGIAMVWRQRPAVAVPKGAEARRVLWRWVLLMAIAGLLVTLLTTATVVRMRWLIPLCVPLVPLSICAVLARAPRATGGVMAVGLILGVVSVAGQWVQSLWINPRTDYDYAALATDMAEAGLPMDIVAVSYAEFANLRLYGVDRVVVPVLPDPAALAPDAATAIWAAGRDGDAARVEAFAGALGLCADGPGTPRTLARRHGEGGLEVFVMPVTAAACAD